MVSLPPPELGPDSARILQSADARCGALYRCSEAAIPPYFMQIIDLETQYAYKKNNLSIQCEQTRPRILISNFQPINQSTNQGLRSTAVPWRMGRILKYRGGVHCSNITVVGTQKYLDTCRVP